MQNKRIILSGGIALLLTGILYPLVFTYLAVRFNYPDVLDGQARQVLPKLLEGGNAFRVAWILYGLLPLLLIPAATGAFYALRKSSEGIMRVALQLAVLASFALMIGLLRWPSIHWELARFYAHADASQHEMVDALFLGLNSYLGNYVGEFLGEGLMHGFLLLTAAAMLKSKVFPKWMAWTGLAVSTLSLIGVLRNVSGLASTVQDFVNLLMLFPLWLIVLGIGLIRYGDRD